MGVSGGGCGHVMWCDRGGCRGVEESTRRSTIQNETAENFVISHGKKNSIDDSHFSSSTSSVNLWTIVTGLEVHRKHVTCGDCE